MKVIEIEIRIELVKAIIIETNNSCDSKCKSISISASSNQSS